MSSFPLKGSQNKRINNADMRTEIMIQENGNIDIKTSFHPKSTLPPIISIVVFLIDSENNILFSNQHHIHAPGHVGLLNERSWYETIPREILKKVTNYAIYHTDTLVVIPYTSDDIKKWSETIGSFIQTFQDDEESYADIPPTSFNHEHSIKEYRDYHDQ